MSEYRKLYLTRDNWVGGVCGGIAEYLDIDPIVIRAIMLILAFVGVIPIVLIYLILWMLIPRRPIEFDDNGRIIR